MPAGKQGWNLHTLAYSYLQPLANEFYAKQVESSLIPLNLCKDSC
jgi:hypothetical protein